LHALVGKADCKRDCKRSEGCDTPVAARTSPTRPRATAYSKVNVTGLANLECKLQVCSKEGKIVNIEFGDVSVLDDDGKGDVPELRKKDAPGLTDVNPKDVEGTP